MTRTRQCPRLVLLIALAVGGVGACVNSPLHGDFVDPTDGATRFDGLAEAPTRRVDIQAKRKDTGQWVTIGVTASSDLPYIDADGDRGYHYIKYVDIDSISNWECFYNAGCYTPGGFVSAEYRAREQYSPLVTLTRPEAQCINARLNAGDGAIEAYETCAGSDRRSMILYWDAPFVFPGDPPAKLP